MADTTESVHSHNGDYYLPKLVQRSLFHIVMNIKKRRMVIKLDLYTESSITTANLKSVSVFIIL